MDGDRAADDNFFVQLVLPHFVFTVIHLSLHVWVVIVLEKGGEGRWEGGRENERKREIIT